MRVALRWVATACLGLLAFVALVTVFFVWAFGHPVAWSVVGCLFAAPPLAALALVVAVGLRAVVAAGPGWIGVRVVGRWRVVDLAQVRVVRMADDGPLPGFGFGFGSPETGGVPGGHPRGGIPGVGRALVLEDSAGRRVDIGVEALGQGLADVVRRGLGPDASVDPDAARALGPAADQRAGPERPGTRDAAVEGRSDAEGGQREQGAQPRP